MDVLVPAAIGIAFWVYFVRNRLNSVKQDNMIAQALDPVEGNPAIQDPFLRAHIGNDLKSFMPAQHPAIKMVKPFDRAPMKIMNSKQFIKNYEVAWQDNYWDKPVNTFIDTDFQSGNGMIPYLAGYVQSKYNE